MWIRKALFFIITCTLFDYGFGCEMEGVGQWALPQTLEVADTDRGVVFTRNTNNILGISSVTHFEGLNFGPYMDLSLTDSNFTINTSTSYAVYEDNETLQSFSITVLFSCTGGSTSILVFLINIRDTNNNAPQFLPSDEYEFTIAPPVPPGFQITGCVNDIIVRDIDLTTQRIEFAVEDNPYFEISYDESSTEPKEFKAVLRTTTLIRNLPEAVELRITATDVDLTGDPPITTSAVVRIQGDTDFQLPEEPIFAQPFYLANYTDNNQLVLSETITLEQGFHEEVQFTLEGEFRENFRLITNGNNLNIEIESPLASVALRSGPILLVVRAERQDTSGATTTVVISTSAGDVLQFENTLYEGLIVDNELQVSPLVLSEGLNDQVVITINSDYSAYFNSELQGASVILSMTSLDDNIINENIYINLEVIASSEVSSASAIVTLAIIKDDNITPMFEKTIYFGSYDPDSGLTLESILLTRGYDETVTISLEGEYDSYFEAVNSGPAINVTVASSSIPTELFVNQHIFISIRANKVRTVGNSAVIVISLPNPRHLGFEAPFYTGNWLTNNTLRIESILLNMGYEDNVSFNISGDYAEYFTVSNDENQVAISLTTELPENVISENNFVAVLLTASGFHAVEATTAIIIDLVQPVTIAPAFSESYYTGAYTIETGLQWEQNIYITQGFDDSVNFALDGVFAAWFSITHEEQYVTLILDSDIPDEVLQSNNHLLFTIVAQKPDTEDGRAVISIELPKENQQPVIIRFTQNSFQGTIENGELQSPIVTLDGESQLPFLLNLTGEFAALFELTRESNRITIELQNPIPVEVLTENSLIVLDIEASYPEAVSGHATVIFEIVKDSEVSVLIFEQAYYVGEYTETDGLLFEDFIRLIQGFDDTVTFGLDGDDAQWFDIVPNGSNNLSLSTATGIPVSDRNYFIFSVVANKSETVFGRTVVVISLMANQLQEELYFSQNYYLGTIENGSLNLGYIRLEEGFSDDLDIILTGDFVEYFQVIGQEGTFSVQFSSDFPSEVIDENSLLVFAVQVNNTVKRAHATIVLDIIKNGESPEALAFEEMYYIGSYSEDDSLIFSSLIVLIQGFDELVEFDFEGENTEWFELETTENPMALRLGLRNPIPPDVFNSFWQLVFVITAQKPAGSTARTVVIISLEKEIITETMEKFDKVLYEGNIRDGVIQHETITITGYNGSDVDIYGEYSVLFTVSNAQGVVTIQGDLVALPPNLTYVVLELRILGSSAVLILDLFYSETPEPSPVIVTFSSASYTVSVDVSQTGLVGRVEATADNGESLDYSLLLDNEHLLERLSIGEEGDLFLSAPVTSGLYIFEVAATTSITGVKATAEVNLAADAVVICAEDNFVVPPLIVIDRDEEEAHRNLVVLDATRFEGCQYTLSNHWPTNQTWLYVDENGLHSTSIDREHESIAFMVLSQVQVELNLECDSDNSMTPVRTARSGVWPDNLGPYDYGNSKWILTDSIPYNMRRSLVNLIVNDINDNYPVFDVKEEQPIAVGYPVSELEEKILPRAFIKLKASDADIGENAAIRYWSSEDVLAVSPLTGFVHIRDNINLLNDATFRVYATDRNGDGLTTSLDIMIKLIDANHIAVVTVRDAFLDDEDTVLDELSVAVGYEVKSLSSAVVPHSAHSDERSSRIKRDLSSATGSSLQLYVYGLISTEPVEVDRLTRDITNHATTTTVNIARTLSLEDYLDSLEICAILGRDTALLVATITLSVLLFLLITSITVWIFLRWRRKQNYDQFSDENSLASRNESLDASNKPDNIPKPRLQIEDLLESEKRLQEILETPVESATLSTTLNKEPEPKTEVFLLEPQAQLQTPIVIQSIDKLKDAEESEDEDDFGERLKSKRKSVVTFNENVEKIIHIEDIPDEISNSEFEVYKF